MEDMSSALHRPHHDWPAEHGFKQKSLGGDLLGGRAAVDIAFGRYYQSFIFAEWRRFAEEDVRPPRGSRSIFQPYFPDVTVMRRVERIG